MWFWSDFYDDTYDEKSTDLVVSNPVDSEVVTDLKVAVKPEEIDFIVKDVIGRINSDNKWELITEGLIWKKAVQDIMDKTWCGIEEALNAFVYFTKKTSDDLEKSKHELGKKEKERNISKKVINKLKGDLEEKDRISIEIDYIDFKKMSNPDKIIKFRQMSYADKIFVIKDEYKSMLWELKIKSLELTKAFNKEMKGKTRSEKNILIDKVYEKIQEYTLEFKKNWSIESIIEGVVNFFK